MVENSENKCFANVVLTIASPQMQDSYTYAVPEWLRKQVQVGSLVLVPVRNSLRRGVVIGLMDEHPKVKYEIKNIITAYGPERILDEKGIELARWIAKYYHSSLFSAVKLLFWDLKNFKVRTEYEIDSQENFQKYIRSKLGLFGGLKKLSKIESVLTERKVRAILKSCEAYCADSEKMLDEMLQLGILRPVYRLEAQKVRPLKDAELDRDKTDRSCQETEINLTSEQKDAIKQIISSIRGNKSDTYLLEGVTGSGKTEIYLRCASEAINHGSVIVLVPEIVLTMQIVERFKKQFPNNLYVLHSGMGDARLKRNWEQLRGSKNKVVIGPRSALFAPLTDIKLVIIDEEHEPAYKQERAPRYHARDVARKLCELRNATLVLGSATPSMESRWLADIEVYKHLVLSRRIHKGGLPEVNTVKLEFGNPAHPQFLSPFLVNEIRKTLERKKQVLLFINQRGFSRALVCLSCGFSPSCPNCNIAYTYHLKGNMLLCHHCDMRIAVPKFCPSCGGKNLLRLGFGTQRVEEEVKRCFPDAKVYRLDRDVATAGGFDGGGLTLMKRFFDEHGDILVGTQMIGKGLDLPDVELVGIVSADTSLTLPDFRAAERTFQIVTQVAGRAGRRDVKGLVILQSFSLGHYAIEAARMQDFRAFYEKEINIRRRLNYPPFVSLARIIYKGKNLNDVQRQAIMSVKIFEDLLSRKTIKLTAMLGPSPAPLDLIAGNHRWHLILKAKEASDLTDAIQRMENRLIPIKGVWMDVDINPMNMM